MKVNFCGKVSKKDSPRTHRMNTSSASMSSSSLPSPVPSKSSTLNYQYTVEPPKRYVQQSRKTPVSPSLSKSSTSSNYPASSPSSQSTFSFSQPGCKSPNVQLSSPNETKMIFDFSSNDYISQGSPKSPRSPRMTFSDCCETPPSQETHRKLMLQSPPKSKPTASKIYNRKQYQSSKTDSTNSAKSSLEYTSTKKHPTGDYQDIEYKICSSQDSDSQHSSDFQTCTKYRYSEARHSLFIEKMSKKKPTCNIRTNPGYDDRRSSNKMINEYADNLTRKCIKSTSDLTDFSDEMATTTMTTLSRPCSPRKRSSAKSGLALLASRRGSRDSVASNMSNVSNEDIGPLTFQNPTKTRLRRTSNFLELPSVPDHIRPRVCSLPEKAFNPRVSDDLYRLRSFSITNKGGVVNFGDCIINRRSRSNTSVNSANSKASNVSGERSPYDGSYFGSGHHTMDTTPLGTPEEYAVPKYRVVMIGISSVGKTALVSQFMTSEYMNTYDASLDDEFGERTVSILLDGEESEMIFIDHPSTEMSVENALSTYEPHACVVVYSVVARASFQAAEETLNYLWRQGYTREKSVIVVGNKADLARSRVISYNEGKALAVSRECKFIETSSGIQHNVDELLVGILKQIRLRENRDKKRAESKKDSHHKLNGSKTSLSLHIAREILQKICLNDIRKSKSCDNLYVL